MATKVTKTKEADNVYITEDGRKIRLDGADPLFLQAAINSVKFPEKPTYEAKTAHGNVEIHDMDEISAKQTPGGEVMWAKYQEEFALATAKQNDVSVRALLLTGTERPSSDYLDKEWMRRMKILGIPIPEDPDEAWVFYLSSSLSAKDLVGIMTKIMRLTGGVDEETIQEVEDSFRDSVLPEPGQDGVDDTE